MWCMYPDICSWWCMYVYVVHESSDMFLVVDVTHVFIIVTCIHTSFEWYIHVHVVYVSVDYVYIDNIYKYKKNRSNGLEMSHFGTQ